MKLRCQKDKALRKVLSLHSLLLSCIEVTSLKILGKCGVILARKVRSNLNTFITHFTSRNTSFRTRIKTVAFRAYVISNRAMVCRASAANSCLNERMALRVKGNAIPCFDAVRNLSGRNFCPVVCWCNEQ